MACFLITVAQAVVTTAITKAVKSKEGKNPEAMAKTGAGHDTDVETVIPFSRKLGWLNKLLWGGSLLLAFEHVWHGEVVPWFPFLTAAADPADAAEMLYEMATVGVAMAVLLTVVWIGIVLVSNALERRGHKAEIAATGQGGL